MRGDLRCYILLRIVLLGCLRVLLHVSTLLVHLLGGDVGVVLRNRHAHLLLHLHWRHSNMLSHTLLVRDHMQLLRRRHVLREVLRLPVVVHSILQLRMWCLRMGHVLERAAISLRGLPPHNRPGCKGCP